MPRETLLPGPARPTQSLQKPADAMRASFAANDTHNQLPPGCRPTKDDLTARRELYTRYAQEDEERYRNPKPTFIFTSNGAHPLGTLPGRIVPPEELERRKQERITQEEAAGIYEPS